MQISIRCLSPDFASRSHGVLAECHLFTSVAVAVSTISSFWQARPSVMQALWDPSSQSPIHNNLSGSHIKPLSTTKEAKYIHTIIAIIVLYQLPHRDNSDHTPFSWSPTLRQASSPESKRDPNRGLTRTYNTRTSTDSRVSYFNPQSWKLFCLFPSTTSPLTNRQRSAKACGKLRAY